MGGDGARVRIKRFGMLAKDCILGGTYNYGEKDFHWR